MEVVKELKRLSLDIDTVGLYDKADEMEKMINSLKAEGEKKGIKKGFRLGANNEKKSIAKNLLKDGYTFNQ